MEEYYLTTEQAAERLNTSVQTVIRMIRSGKLYAFKLSRNYRIPNSAINDLRYSNKTR